jgi:hypothetical protein
MPQKAWSAKRERQYVHIKDSLLERGKPEPLAEEIAARVVNKERAQHGESVEASPSSINDLSAGRRGGLRSHKGPGGRTLLQLRNEARQRGLKGRAAMNKPSWKLHWRRHAAHTREPRHDPTVSTMDRSAAWQAGADR